MKQQLLERLARESVNLYEVVRRDYEQTVDDIVQGLLEAMELVATEATMARLYYPPFHSAHEGYAVLKEEVDQLWQAIKANDPLNARKEAIQVGAMALRFIAEIPSGQNEGKAPCAS